jgi:hypothetical protein
VTAGDTYGYTALHLAAEAGHVPFIRIMLRAGAFVTATTEDGRTPLHLSAQKGHARAAKVLLSAGASVTSADKEGRSALLAAADAGHEDVVEVLLRQRESGVGRDEVIAAAHQALQQQHWGVAALLMREAKPLSALHLGLGAFEVQSLEQLVAALAGGWEGAVVGLVEKQREREGERVGVQVEKEAWHALFMSVLLEAKRQGYRG